MNLTKSFPTNKPPTIPGVYLTRRSQDSINFWRAFDGKDWYYGIVQSELGSPSYEAARRKGKMIKGVLLTFRWQGLAEKPE
jgi:hypothetical protein